MPRDIPEDGVNVEAATSYLETALSRLEAATEARIVEEIAAAYEESAIVVKELVSRNGRLLASLKSNAPKTVAFIDDEKFRAALRPSEPSTQNFPTCHREGHMATPLPNEDAAYCTRCKMRLFN